MNNKQKNQMIKKNIQQFHMQTKQMKKNTLKSFENNFGDNPQFDAYIKSQFEKMIEEKGMNPTLIIPNGFRKFINSRSFKELLKKIYQYTDAMIQFQRKYEETQKQGFNPNNIQMLRHQTNTLQQKCKEISFVYMGILLSYGQCNAIFKDQYFFETMMYFISKVLRGNFEQSDFPRVQQELNRIFRTDAFNLIKRRHQQDKIYTKYPILKQQKYESNNNSVSYLLKRLALQKKHHYSMQIKPQKQKRITKPLDITLSTFKSTRSRSPLIASFYPSQKQKLFGFSQAVRQKDTFIKSIYKRSSYSMHKY